MSRLGESSSAVACGGEPLFRDSPFPDEVVGVTVGLAVLGWVLTPVYLSPRSCPVALRVVGAVVLSALLENLVRDALVDQRGPLVWFVSGFVGLGLPAFYLLVYGRIPGWCRRFFRSRPARRRVRQKAYERVASVWPAKRPLRPGRALEIKTQVGLHFNGHTLPVL